MQLFELEPVVSEMIEQTESEHAPVHRRPRNPSSIRVARSCRRYDERLQRSLRRKEP
jgi:hypothetical protein